MRICPKSIEAREKCLTGTHEKVSKDRKLLQKRQGNILEAQRHLKMTEEQQKRVKSVNKPQVYKDKIPGRIPIKKH